MEKIIDSVTRLITVLSEMRKRHLLLIGFMAAITILFGALTGYIPSPFLTAIAQHESLISDQKELRIVYSDLVTITRLQLYLSREICIQGAKTPSDRSRCDKETIREAIVGDILTVDPLIPIAALK